MHPSFARDRRSVVVLSLPVTETRFEDRIALFREGVYASPDMRSVLPTTKTSATDSLINFVSHDLTAKFQLAAQNLSQFYRPGIPMATQSYRATVYYPNSTLPTDNTWGINPGAGPLNNPPGRCAEESARAFNGMGQYAKTIMPTRTM